VPDPAGCRHGQGGDTADEPTSNGCRNAQLTDGKPSSCWIADQADDQPNNRSDHTRRGGSDGCAPFNQGGATWLTRSHKRELLQGPPYPVTPWTVQQNLDPTECLDP
jgi:hypothetical protein